MWRTTTCCFLSHASSSAPSRDDHGRPMPERRRPRNRQASASRPPPRHPHLNGDPHQVSSSARATLWPPPHSSTARAFQPPHARSRGEELPATSLSSTDKPAGRPGLLLASTRTHACRDGSPHSCARSAWTPAARHHPFCSCVQRRRVPDGGERKWISGGFVTNAGVFLQK